MLSGEDVVKKAIENQPRVDMLWMPEVSSEEGASGFKSPSLGHCGSIKSI